MIWKEKNKRMNVNNILFLLLLLILPHSTISSFLFNTSCYPTLPYLPYPHFALTFFLLG